MNIFYTKEEKGKNALLFLHGWGCDGGIFAPVTAEIRATCVAVDFPGFGKSDAPPEEGWSVLDYARRLHAFCEENLPASFCIVAHSFGARVAVVFAALYPEMVTGMVLTGAAGLRRFSLARQVRVARYKILKKLKNIGWYKKELPAGSRDFSLLRTEAMRRTFVKVVREDLSAYARRISAPVLLVQGKEDEETPLWMAKRYLRLLKNGTLIFLDGGHFAFLQNAALFGNICETFSESL